MANLLSTVHMHRSPNSHLQLPRPQLDRRWRRFESNLWRGSLAIAFVQFRNKHQRVSLAGWMKQYDCHTASARRRDGWMPLSSGVEQLRAELLERGWSGQ